MNVDNSIEISNISFTLREFIETYYQIQLKKNMPLFSLLLYYSLSIYKTILTVKNPYKIDAFKHF